MASPSVRTCKLLSTAVWYTVDDLVVLNLLRHPAIIAATSLGINILYVRGQVKGLSTQVKDISKKVETMKAGIISIQGDIRSTADVFSQGLEGSSRA